MESGASDGPAHRDETRLLVMTKDAEPVQPTLMAAPDLQPAEVRWYFGDFVVWEAQRRLERAGEAVRTGPRSFDLLLQLLKRAGEFGSKSELMSSVWTAVVVEEASVRVHMSTLRKTLEIGRAHV